MSKKDKRRIPIVKHTKLNAHGSSYTIVIPKAWLEVHGIDPEKTDKLLIVANMDIRIVNPNHEDKVYEEVSKITGNAKI